MMTITPKFHDGELVYDDSAAMLFIREMTGLPAAVVERFMVQKNLYEYGFGLMPDEPDDLEFWGTTKRTLRARCPALFPADKIAKRELPPTLQCRFIVQESGLSEKHVRAMQHADREYQIRAGILVQVID